MTFDLFKNVLIQIKKRKLRTILTMIQVMFGIAIIALVLHLILGLWEGYNDMQSNVYESEIIIEKENYDKNLGFSLEEEEKLKKDIETISGVSPFNHSYDVLLKNDNFFYRTRDMGEVGPDYKNMADLSMVKGSFFTKKDVQQNSRVVVLSRELADRLFPDSDPLNQKIKINPNWNEENLEGELKEYVVTGVYEKNRSINVGNFFKHQLLIPHTDDNNLSVYIQIKEGKFTPTEAALSVFARDKHDQGELILSGIYPRGYSPEEYKKAFSIILILLSVFGFLIIICSSIGILSTMLVNIMERIRQVGIEKTLGASAKVIFLKFNLEAVILSLGGCALGLIFAYFTADYVALAFLKHLVEIRSGLHPLSIIVSILISIIVGFIFGIYPAFQAANIEITEALMEEK
ncbi:MAG: ABC transporter permease [bacterium]